MPEASHSKLDAKLHEGSELREAALELTRADYYLGCAASTLEGTARTGWTNDADRLMRECIALRERIYDEVGRP